MSRIWDIEYLLAAHRDGPVRLDRALIYRYRSGVLRQKLMAILHNVAELHERELSSGSLPLRPGFAEGGLYGHLALYDWSRSAIRKLKPRWLDDSLSLLAAGEGAPSAHFVPHDSAVTKHPAWPAVERACFVLEETLVTYHSLLPTLRYLEATTDLARGADFLGQPGFRESFGDLLEDRGGVGLPEIIQAFDERVLLCTDRVTNRFDGARHRGDVRRRQGHTRPLRHLRDLVEYRRAADLVELVSAFDERQAACGWTASRLVRELYRITIRLLDTTNGAGASADAALLWAALVLAWEDRLGRSIREEEHGYRRGPDMLVTAVDGLGRDFLARGAETASEDPLAGRWLEIARSLGRYCRDDPSDRLATVRDAAVEVLATASGMRTLGMPWWIRHLHAGALAAVAQVERCACGRDDEAFAAPSLEPPRTFAALTGRTHAVEAVRGLVRRRDFGTDLLLYGPEGVGKRTLARLYAKAVLCDALKPDGSPCDDCEACRDFDQSINFIEIDGRSANIGTLTESLIKVVRYQPFSGGRVIAVRNADDYPPEIFDQLLQPMEQNPNTSFVLQARDPRRVREAGRSRCHDIRVRPLSRDEMVALAREICFTRGVVCDEAVVALQADAGRGLPGRLHHVCAAVAGLGTPILSELRARLGLDWAADLISHWPDIIVGASVMPIGLMRPTRVGRTEQSRRVRRLLQHVYLRGLHGLPSDTTDPALRYLADEATIGLVAEFQCQAACRDADPDALWFELAETWLSERLAHDWQLGQRPPDAVEIKWSDDAEPPAG